MSAHLIQISNGHQLMREKVVDVWDLTIVQKVSFVVQALLWMVAIVYFYPALYWTMILPINVYSSTYEKDSLIINGSLSERSISGRQKLSLKVATGVLKSDNSNERVGLPGDCVLHNGEDVDVWVDRSSSSLLAREGVQGLALRCVSDVHMQRRSEYCRKFLVFYWPLVLLALYRGIVKRKYLLGLIISENKDFLKGMKKSEEDREKFERNSVMLGESGRLPRHFRD